MICAPFYHASIYADQLGAPARRTDKARRNRLSKLAAEQQLASSPLRTDNPQFAEWSGQSRRNQRATGSPGTQQPLVSNPETKFSPESDPLADLLAETKIG
jgi:hypothetical protein